jgi:hypothetical protein
MMLSITLGHQDTITLDFKLRNTPLAELWVERMNKRHAWPLDHPDRFYGFNTLEQERARAETYIETCITVINNHQQIIHRPFEWTQDSLNYLHHIFEVYHGLLDQQTSEYWQSAPNNVRQALAELNLAVHRCETAMRPLKPRFVCTWFGMPKTHQLSEDLQKEYGESNTKFGTVYLNYCEIGKTVEDLEHDNDKYIADEAFKPFSHYSADFIVQFYDNNLSLKHTQIQNYIDQHREFFLARNIDSVYNIKAQPLRFPVADLIYTGDREQLINEISKRQCVSNVDIK